MASRDAVRVLPPSFAGPQHSAQAARIADAGPEGAGSTRSGSLKRKPVPAHTHGNPSITLDVAPDHEFAPPQRRSGNSDGWSPRLSASSLPSSSPSHSRDVSRDVETPEPDRLRDSGTALPVTKTIPIRQMHIERSAQNPRQSQVAEVASVETAPDDDFNDVPDDGALEDEAATQAYPQLQYFHQPFEEPAEPPPRRGSRGQVKSMYSDSPTSSSDHSGGLQVPRSTAPRPASAYTLGTELNAGRGRNHSPHLSVNGSPSPTGSPMSYGRSLSASRRSPDNRPTSYIDLLNTPYAQQVAPVANLNNAQLRSAVGSNIALLDTKKTLEMYRANVKKTTDLGVQYEFALFLVQAAQQALAGDPGADVAGMQTADLLREARQILQRLADKSYPFAQYYLADGYTSGLFSKGKEDYDRAFPLFVAASKHSHAESGYRAALCYEFGWGCRKDPAKAVQFYRASASKGHPGAATRLGKACIFGGLGLENRHREGIKWLKRAAESADFQYNSAPFELGLLHENGFGEDIFKDEAYTAQLFTQAAELGHVEASFRMGEAYEHGHLDCPRDPALSVHFYNGAAQAGLPKAMMNLCAWYLVGAPPVLEKDENEAYEWAKKAAELGLAKAEYAVGYFTEMGIGCRRDPLEANVWYVKAADQGDERAKQRLAIIQAAASGSAGTADSKLKGKKKDDKDCIVM